MALKLAVENLVGVKIEGTNNAQDGSVKPFKFTLVCERLSADDMRKSAADKDETIPGFFERHARDWQGQRLVLDDNDQPAAFSTEALQMLLSIQGMAQLCWHSYLQQAAAKAKN